MVTGQDSSVRTVQSSSGAMLDRNSFKAVKFPKETRLSRLSRMRNWQRVEMTSSSILPLAIGGSSCAYSYKKREVEYLVVKGAKWRANVHRLGANVPICTSMSANMLPSTAATPLQSHFIPYGCL